MNFLLIFLNKFVGYNRFLKYIYLTLQFNFKIFKEILPRIMGLDLELKVSISVYKRSMFAIAVHSGLPVVGFKNLQNYSKKRA